MTLLAIPSPPIRQPYTTHISPWSFMYGAHCSELRFARQSRRKLYTSKIQPRVPNL